MEKMRSFNRNKYRPTILWFVMSSSSLSIAAKYSYFPATPMTDAISVRAVSEQASLPHSCNTADALLSRSSLAMASYLEFSR